MIPARVMLLMALAAVQASSVCAQTSSGLPPARELKVRGATVHDETYRGCQSIRLDPAMDPTPFASGLALLPGPPFRDGVIQLRIAGDMSKNASPTDRGFVGIAFRVQPGVKRYEMLYMRPSNGRADDQLRRNHSLQYVSEPEYPWQRLRKETPGQYESYTDLQLGAWTTMRIEVHGTKALLFINGASQPQLIVNDLKHGNSAGAIALWAGPGAVGHFCRPSFSVRAG